MHNAVKIFSVHDLLRWPLFGNISISSMHIKITSVNYTSHITDFRGTLLFYKNSKRSEIVSEIIHLVGSRSTYSTIIKACRNRLTSNLADYFINTDLY